MSIINEALKKAENLKKPESSPVMPPEKVFEPFRGIVPEEKTITPEDKIKVIPRPIVKKGTVVKKKASLGWFLLPAALAGIVVVAFLVFKYGSSIDIPLAGNSPKPSVSLPAPAQPVSPESAPQAKPDGNLITNLFNWASESKTSGMLDSRQFVLTGISNSGGTRAAIVNNEVVEEGASIGGARVISITDDKVDLQAGNKTVTLTLD